MDQPSHPQMPSPPPSVTSAYTTGFGVHGATYPMHGAPGFSIPRTLSATGRATAAVYALGAVVLFHLIAIPLSLWENSLIRSYGLHYFDSGSPDLAAWGLTTFGAALGLIVATIACCVLFLMWVHRANRLLHVNNVPDIRFTSGWAVGWWFVPVANVIRPYEVVRELFFRSDRRMVGTEPSPMQTAASGSATFVASASARDRRAPERDSSWIIGAWWITWLVAAAATNISSRIVGGADSAEQLIRGNLLGVGASLLFVLAGILAIIVIRDIDQRQRRAFRTGH